MFFPNVEPLVTWQGFPCVAKGGAFRMSRTPGYSADTGSVEVPMRSFKSASVEPNLERFFNDIIIQGGGTRTTQSGQVGGVGAIPTGKKFGIVGDLIMELDRQVILPDIYLKEDGIEEVVWTEKGGDGPIVRIPIADIRYWWGRRGTTPHIRGNWRNADGKISKETFNPETNKPYTVKDYLDILVKRLPGRPDINRVPEGLDVEGPRVDWPEDSPLAMDAIRRIGKTFGIILTLDVIPPGTVSFWRDQEGDIGHGSNNSQKFPDAALVQSPRSVSFSFPPEAVIVEGPPTLIETSQDLEIAALDEDGRIMDWEDWLKKNFALTPEQAGKLVLQNPRVMKEKLSDDQAKLFRAQAFRVYKIKDKERPTKIPILNLLSVDSVGRRLPPRVESDGFSEMKETASSTDGTDAAEKDTGVQGDKDSTRARGVDEGVAAVKPGDQARAESIQGQIDIQKDLIAQQSESKRADLGRVESEISKTNDSINELNAKLESTPDTFNNIGPRARIEKDISIAKALLNIQQLNANKIKNEIFEGNLSNKTIIRNLKKQLDKIAPSTLGADIFVNLPIGEVLSSQYQIDRLIGVVKFNSPRGTLEKLDVESKEMSSLRIAKGKIIYSYADKPEKGGDPLKPEDLEKKHYTAKFIWNAGKPKKVDKLNDTIFPRPIQRKDLELHKFLNGTDNKEELDKVAQSIADSLMKVEPGVKGIAPILATFLPVNCNGKVLGVKWSSDGLRAVTEVQASASRRGPGASGDALRQALASMDATGRTVVRIPGGQEVGMKEKEVFEIVAAFQAREG